MNAFKKTAVVSLDRELPQLASLVIEINSIQRELEEALNTALATGKRAVLQTPYQRGNLDTGDYHFMAWTRDAHRRMTLRVQCNNTVILAMVKAAITKCVHFEAEDIEDDGPTRFRCTILGASEQVAARYERFEHLMP